MNMTIYLSIIFTSIAWILLLVMAFLFYDYYKRLYNKQIFMFEKVGDAYIPEILNARLINHEELGQVYYVPKLKRRGVSPYVYYSGPQDENPTPVGYRRAIVMCGYSGSYVPGKLFFYEKREYDNIDAVDGKLKINKIITEEPIIKPLKSTTRMFNINLAKVNDKMHNNDSWWEKNKYIVAGLGIVFACVVVGIIIVIFSYQSGGDLVNQFTELLSGFQGTLGNVINPTGVAP